MSSAEANISCRLWKGRSFINQPDSSKIVCDAINYEPIPDGGGYIVAEILVTTCQATISSGTCPIDIWFKKMYQRK